MYIAKLLSDLYDLLVPLFYINFVLARKKNDDVVGNTVHIGTETPHHSKIWGRGAVVM